MADSPDGEALDEAEYAARLDRDAARRAVDRVGPILRIGILIERAAPGSDEHSQLTAERARLLEELLTAPFMTPEVALLAVARTSSVLLDELATQNGRDGVEVLERFEMEYFNWMLGQE